MALHVAKQFAFSRSLSIAYHRHCGNTLLMQCLLVQHLLPHTTSNRFGRRIRLSCGWYTAGLILSCGRPKKAYFDTGFFHNWQKTCYLLYLLPAQNLWPIVVKELLEPSDGVSITLAAVTCVSAKAVSEKDAVPFVKDAGISDGASPGPWLGDGTGCRQKSVLETQFLPN